MNATTRARVTRRKRIAAWLRTRTPGPLAPPREPVPWLWS